jgi:hypothetical protein
VGAGAGAAALGAGAGAGLSPQALMPTAIKAAIIRVRFILKFPLKMEKDFECKNSLASQSVVRLSGHSSY